MNQYIEKLKVWWNGLPDTTKKMVIGVPLLTFLLYFVVFRGLSNEVSYGVLFKNIELEKASAAANYLDEKGIPYKLQDGGRTILVPRKHNVERLKLSLAEQDIVASDEMPGHKLLTDGGFGLGEEQIRARKNIALEGNLAKIIKGYQQVEDAKVLITPGQESAFIKDTEPAKASVTITLKSGEKLEPQQIKGISRIVAGAVPGLNPDNVAITDQWGNLLSKKAEGALGSANQQLEYKREVERQLEDKAQNALNEMLGPNQAKVTINADINYDETVRKTTFVDPEERVKDVEDVVEIEDQRKPPFGGVPGTDSQIAERLPLLRSTLASEKRVETRKRTKYDSTKRQQIDKTMPGEIKRLSVALAVSDKMPLFAPRDNYEHEEKTFAKGVFVDWVARPQSDVTRIGNLVKETVGFNEARGDSFKPELVSFFSNRHLPVVTTVSLWQRLTQPHVLLPGMAFLALCAAVGHYLSRRRAEQRYREELRLAETPSIEVSRAIQELAAQVVHSPEVVAQALQDMIREDEEKVETPAQPAPSAARPAQPAAAAARPSQPAREPVQQAVPAR
jgi:flagellar M-ring protein FliF